MNIINSNTIEKAKQYVSDLLDHQLSKECVFHSKAHTFDVLKNVELIGKYGNLEEGEMNILRVSALFHDVGYARTYKGHELESVLIAKKFLQRENIDESIISKISAAIQSTKAPQQPKDKLSGILCDADLMHLTYDNYFAQIEFLRMEWELMGIAKMSENEFHINSVIFFNSNEYHSDYGKKILIPKKEKTLKHIKAKIMN